MEPLQLLKPACERFARTCAGATPAQWSHCPPEGGWSMGHVAEHVTIANRLMVARLQKLAPIAPRAPEVIDEEIPYLFYRGDEPPNVAAPAGDWRSRAEHAAEYERSVADILAWRPPPNLRGVGARHPVFGLLDGAQWLLYVVAHTERHRAQLIGLAREATGAG